MFSYLKTSWYLNKPHKILIGKLARVLSEDRHPAVRSAPLAVRHVIGRREMRQPKLQAMQLRHLTASGFPALRARFNLTSFDLTIRPTLGGGSLEQIPRHGAPVSL
jgi:hypothetical protein